MKQATIRLNKFLAQAGLGSRRSVEDLIRAGRVKVNKTVISFPGHMVDPTQDEVVYDGNIITQEIEPTYIVLNKPVDFICSRNDEKGRRTVYQLVRTPQQLFTIGRLDQDSEGLLIFTNDGEFANRLIHPRYKVPKKYYVELKKPAPPNIREIFKNGVIIDRKVRVTGELHFPNPKNRKSCFVTIHEGRNRQVRKMFAAVDCRVKVLHRTEIGPLKLGSLALGAWRYLTNRELRALKKAVGLDHGDDQ